MTIRRATPADAPECGRICYEAFAHINHTHGFPPDFPSVEAGVGVVASMFSHPGFYCVVAEEEGRVLGSNCLDERSVIHGIGPITVDPATQNSGVGAALMRAVLDRSAEQAAPGVRLVQVAFHNRSLSLYTKLGFDVREPLAVFQGPPILREVAGHPVRPAVHGDLGACNRLALRLHGHHRSAELLDAIHAGTATVVERHSRLTGYSTGIAFFGHTLAETNTDLEALIAAAPAFGGPGFLLPTRNSEMFRWCLARGLRIVQQMNLMSLGLYNQPAGAFLPSVTF